MNIKRIVKSDGFRTYFWPIFLCYLFTLISMFFFAQMDTGNQTKFLFEPGGQIESIFVLIGGTIWISCLWILVARYRKIKDKSVGKRAMILLTGLTAIILLSVISRICITFLNFILIFPN